MGTFKNNWNSEMLFEDYDVTIHDQGNELGSDAYEALNKVQRKEKKRSKHNKKRKICWQ